MFVKPGVLLTYCWVRSSYAALRNFTGHGLNTAISDNNKIGMCQYSRYASAFFQYPNPLQDEKAFIEALSSFICKNNIKMLLPSHDETSIIARNASMLPSTCALPFPSIDLLDLANDKSQTQVFAQAEGIKTAARITYGTVDELRTLLNNKKYTALVIRLRRGNSAKGVFYPSNANECIGTVSRLIQQFKLPVDRYPVIQEYVDGEGWGVSCLYWHGERIAHFTHRRLREKTQTGGTSTFREHQPNELLEKMAFQLLDKMQWHGLAMVEFKYNALKKQGWFIEINPRLWGSIHLAISAGVEFPWLLYLCATDGPESAKKYQSSIRIKYPWRSRWYLGDCIIALNKISKGRILSGLKMFLPGNTDSYDDLHWDDPGAFFGEAGYYLYNAIKYRSTNPVSEGMVG
jgi:predicted ATP-grasp superfamily ATP-dependent carboligase